MVVTRGRRMGDRRCERLKRQEVETADAGSVRWFAESQGLNAVGYIPGTDLHEEHCSKAEYNAFWGPKNRNNGGRYKRNVSPRMVRRIRSLYHCCFQKPIGTADALPYHFGRGLLAERNGYPINWAAYARKMTHRGTEDTEHLGRTPTEGRELCRRGVLFQFESLEALRHRTPHAEWPKNEAVDESDGEEGRDDDWEVNVKFDMKPDGIRDFAPTPKYIMPAPALCPFDSCRTQHVLGLRAPTSLKRTSSDAAKIAESTLDVAAKGTSANADTTMREDLPTCEGCGLERVPKRRLAVGAEEANRNIPFETGRIVKTEFHGWDAKPTESELAAAMRQFTEARRKGKEKLNKGHAGDSEALFSGIGSSADYRVTLIPKPSKTGQSNSTCTGLTLESCREHVALKVALAKELLMEKNALVENLRTKTIQLTAALGVLDMRLEKEKRQYELEVAVTNRLLASGSASCARDVVNICEGEALKRKEDCQADCHRTWTCKMKARNEARRLIRDIVILQRISAQWEEDVESYASRLYYELQRIDIDEAVAFQNAGLKCPCEDPSCEFPFYVDDSHSHL
ncbi:hypothetical protein M758_UG252400 [Ceratodon purpureus]|nr:hypothetical protein M758_UG252400 [Ceratodon purpureus]